MSQRSDALSIGGKGLAGGQIGTFSGAVLGISSVAPGYTLSASVGLLVAAVGLKMPAILIAGFVPMFLTAYAYRELNSKNPDAGASFTWSSRAFGPYVGWMAGWGQVVACIIVLSNLAAVAVQFFYLFLAQVSRHPAIAELASNKPVNIATTLAIMLVATYVACRGISTGERVQYALVGFQMLMLFGFAGAALWKVGTGAAPGHLSFDIDWFNPFTGLTIGAFVVGVTGSVFAFWGWDTCLTLGEESKDPDRVPGRAGLLSVTSILLTYLLVAVALTMYAGVGTTGLGLGNPANEENIFGALADPVLGTFFGPFLSLAVLTSAVAGLQTTFLPLARVMLAMGVYGAVPRRFAEISPRFLVPRFSTIMSSAVTAVFYTVVTVLSEHTLTDTIAALGIMICWYYGITAFACIWEFRRTLFRSFRNVVFRFLCPLFGGAMLIGIFAISIRESMDPANGSGSSICGIGLVFFLGFGILALGVVLMLIQRAVAPRFFTENTWHAGSEKGIAETLVPECPEPTKDLSTA